MILPRLKPDPLPAINPVAERLVSGRRAELYDATKAGLQVPWMGVVTMAFADYEPFYEVLWAMAGPIFATQEAANACMRMRGVLETEVLTLGPESVPATLDARAMIEVFSHGNYPYTFIATVARLALEGDLVPVGGAGAIPFAGAHKAEGPNTLSLVEPEGASAEVLALYERIKDDLGLLFVNTDYRAFANWPDWFGVAWSRFSPVVATRAYDAVVERMHHAFVAEALDLPNPAGVTAADLRDAALRSAPEGEVLEVVRLFQWLLPGLCANVAFLRAQAKG